MTGALAQDVKKECLSIDSGYTIDPLSQAKVSYWKQQGDCLINNGSDFTPEGVELQLRPYFFITGAKALILLFHNGSLSSYPTFCVVRLNSDFFLSQSLSSVQKK